jgi:hypothetical protein
VLLACPTDGQQAPVPFPQPTYGRSRLPNGQGNNAEGEADPVAQLKRAKMLNAERQKEMVSDSAKLLRLAQELNAEVAQGDASNLSGGQMRKLAEIEKLARSVREKMTFSLGGSSPSADPLGLTR